MFKDLTKGGQTFFQSWRMFFAIFWKIITVFLLVFIVVFLTSFYFKMTSYQRYKLAEGVEIAPFTILYDAFEKKLAPLGLSLSPSKTQPKNQDFEYSNGKHTKLSDDEITNAIITPDFIEVLKDCALWSAIDALLLGLFMAVLLTKLFIHFGKNVSKQKTLRGSTSCGSLKLAKLIKTSGKLSSLKIADIPLPYAAETKHCLITGSVGSGKTVCLSELMAQVRKQNHKAIVYDKMGTHTARFYRPGKDILLNPFDSRSPLWLLANEIKMDSDYKSIAASLIPEDGKNSQDPFWNMAARELLAAAAKYLHQEGLCQNTELLDYVLGADLERIKLLLENTVVGSLVSEHSEKTTTSIKSILTAYISSLEYLPTEGEPFSIRDWVSNEEDDSWLFITSRADMHQAVKPLISTWLDIATNAVLSLPRSKDRRIFEFLDELPTLQTLPSLPTAMAEGRQFGLCVFITIQSLSQIYKHYGEHSANEVMDLCNTLVALRAPDPKTANRISDMLSEAEVEDFNESLSYGVTDNRDGVSISRHRHMQKVALPAEIQNLDDLTGYLRVPGNFPVSKVTFEYVDYEEPEVSFILREGMLIEATHKKKKIPTGEDEPVSEGLKGVADKGVQFAEPVIERRSKPCLKKKNLNNIEKSAHEIESFNEKTDDYSFE